MKTRKTLLLASAFFVLSLTAIPVFAQQSKTAHSPAATQKVPLTGADAYAVYSYRLYNAPNNTFGYDILKNGKLVYHQYVLMLVSNEGKRIFASKPQTERSAMIAIAKIKNGQKPDLSSEELQKILSL
jgi:hypothetical protein